MTKMTYMIIMSKMTRMTKMTRGNRVQGELHCHLSTVNLPASMSCLLDRNQQAGPGEGTKQRTRKVEWVPSQEERMAAEREGQWTTRVMGHSLLRKGRILSRSRFEL